MDSLVICPMNESPKIQTISVDQLQLGMFVVKLDIPWLASPFVRHSRLIKSDVDIDKLKKAGVKALVIDLERGKHPEPLANNSSLRPNEGRAFSPSTNNCDDTKKITPDSFVSSHSLSKEMNVALNLRSKIKSTVSRLHLNVERDGVVDHAELVPLIEDAVASLQRNNQALLNLVHMSRKSQKLADHSFSTFCLSLNIAVNLNLTETDRDALGVAALLHDVGWVQLPLHLMGKRTAYTVVEKRLMESHVEIGLKMLVKSNLPQSVLTCISQHHECCDSRGYPAGDGEGTLLYISKLLAVAVNYDESVHQLTDKPGMLPTNALRKLYLEAEKGKYSIEVVAALINILGVYPVTSAVLLNTGEKGVVEQVFSSAHMEPIIRIFYGINGEVLKTPKVIDLRLQDEAALNVEARRIERVLDCRNTKDDPKKLLEPHFD